MKFSTFIRTAAAVAILAIPGTAFAQATGAEIVGQPIMVTTNGVTNTLYFDQGGTLRILTPAQNTVTGTWAIANGQLCINNGTAQECFPYAAPMVAQQPMTVTSSCGATSTWLAQATNMPAPPPPVAGEKGERGR